MSNNVSNDSRRPFFPNSKTSQSSQAQEIDRIEQRSGNRRKHIKAKRQLDSRVEIPESVKDFAKIKRAADLAPDFDQAQKVSELKQKIDEGTYNIDYDAVAERMLQEVL